MTTSQLESRVSALEREMAQLKNAQAKTPLQALEQIHGTFENDAAFREAVRLGKKWRKAQDAKPRPKAKRR